MPATREDDCVIDKGPKPDQKPHPPRTASHRRVPASNRVELSQPQVSKRRIRCPGCIHICGRIVIQRLPNPRTSRWSLKPTAESPSLQSPLVRYSLVIGSTTPNPVLPPVSFPT